MCHARPFLAIAFPFIAQHSFCAKKERWGGGGGECPGVCVFQPPVPCLFTGHQCSRQLAVSTVCPGANDPIPPGGWGCACGVMQTCFCKIFKLFSFSMPALASLQQELTRMMQLKSPATPRRKDHHVQRSQRNRLCMHLNARFALSSEKSVAQVEHFFHVKK